MKKFSFSLEAVLKMRSLEVFQKKAEFEKIHTAYLRLVNQREEIREEKAHLHKTMQETHLTTGEVIRHIQFLGDSLVLIEEQLGQIKKKLDEKQKELEMTLKKQKVIENLKEKQYTFWMHQTTRKENLEIDEITSQRTFK